MAGLYRGASGLALGTGLWAGSPGLWNGATGLQDGGGFSPLSLFAASEPGFWFDPSDISTLFQDNWGVTPVTAAGQSAGLALDKSRGLVATGSNLASSDLTTWNKAGTATTPTATTATFPASNDFIFISPAVSAGKAYEIRAVLSGSGTLTLGAYATTAGFGPALGNITLTGTPTEYVVTRYYLPGDTDRRVIIGRLGSASATAVTVGSISVKEIPGNHATQSTSLSRPTYQVDSNGRGHLLFDGSDDFLVTPTITPGTDKAQMFAGVRKLADVNASIAEVSSNGTSVNGALVLQAWDIGRYGVGSRGTVGISALPSTNTFVPPITNVLTGLGDISGDSAILRANGAQVASNTGDQGTGNYLAYPAYIGRRGGTSLPFNGRIYGLIFRFGPNLTADQIAQTEAWVNSKTGAY